MTEATYEVTMEGGFAQLDLANKIAAACKHLGKQLDIGWWQLNPVPIWLEKKGNKVEFTFVTDSSANSMEDALYRGKTEGYLQGIRAGAKIPCKVECHGGKGATMFYSVEFRSVDDMVKFLNSALEKQHHHIDAANTRKAASR